MRVERRCDITRRIGDSRQEQTNLTNKRIKSNCAASSSSGQVNPEAMQAEARDAMLAEASREEMLAASARDTMLAEAAAMENLQKNLAKAAYREERDAMLAETRDAMLEAKRAAHREEATESAHREALRVTNRTEAMEKFYLDEFTASKREMDSKISALQTELSARCNDAKQSMAAVQAMHSELAQDARMRKLEAIGRDLMYHMKRGHKDDADEILRDTVQLQAVAKIQDNAGMTPLHVACRLVHEEWVETLIEAYPDAANFHTFSVSNPKRWTPLQCMADTPAKVEGKCQMQAICTMLIEIMSAEALCSQTETGGQTFLHTMASRGHCSVIEHVLPLLKEQLGGDELGEPQN
jgi:hypothetical protein